MSTSLRAESSTSGLKLKADYVECTLPEGLEIILEALVDTQGHGQTLVVTAELS